MRTLAALVSRLSGGTHPRAVSLAVFLGLLAGFVQGWNLSLVALFALIVLFDVRSRVALVCWGIGLGLSWLLAPVTFLLGRVVLDLTPLGVWLGQLGNGRWATLFGWDQYTVVGGLLIGLALAWPASSLLTRGVRRTRRLLHEARKLRGRFEPDAAPAVIAFPRSRISRRARFFDWLRGANSTSATGGEGRLFRRGGLTAAAALIAVTAGVVFWHVPQMTRGNLYLAMQAANQARLEAGSFELALWDGNLQIRDLRLADPACLTHDRLRIAQLRADLDPTALLAGRLAVRRLDVSGVKAHVPRTQPAEPLSAASDAIELDDAPVLPHNSAAAAGDRTSVQQCLSNWPEVEQAIGRLGDLLAQVQRLHDHDEPPTPSLSLAAVAQTDLIALRRARSSLGKTTPKVFVASLRVENLDPAWRLGGRATLQAEQLSSSLAAAKQARIEIDAPDCGTRLWAEFASHQGNPRWTVHLDARNISLAKQFAGVGQSQPLAIDGGYLSVVGSGWADQLRFELPLRFETHELACHATQRTALAGINSELWATGLGRLGDFLGEAVCHGDWHQPRLDIDAHHFAERFRHQLRSGGQHELLASIERDMQPSPADGSGQALAQTEQHPPADLTASAEPTSAATTAQPLLATTTPATGTPAAAETQTAATPNPSTQSVMPPEAAVAASLPSPSAPSGAATAAVAAAPSHGAQQPVAQPVAAGPRSDLPVIETARPLPGATPVVAAVTSPLAGPGPVDLALGHDLSIERWQVQTPAAAANLAQAPPRREMLESREPREPSTDAELDAWVQQQERVEARRERELARQNRLASEESENLAADTGDLESPVEGAAKPGWLARVRGLWPFGKTAAPDDEIYELTPDSRLDEPARTARGPIDAPADGSPTKWR